MPKREVRAKVGDIFAIPIGENLFCFGQIVAEIEPNPKLCVMFDFALDNIPDTISLTDKPILAIAHMHCFTINDNEWPIIGNAEAVLQIQNIIFPFYKIYQGNQLVINDYFGNFVRNAEEKDEKALDYRTTYSDLDFISLARDKFVFHGDMESLEKAYGDIMYHSSKWLKINLNQDIAFTIQAQQKLPEELLDRDNEQKMISIAYKLGNNGFDKPEYLEERYYIQELLDTCLKKSGLGDCDGGEIGKDTMTIYCFVSDLERGLNLIKAELEKHHLLDNTVISVQRH